MRSTASVAVRHVAQSFAVIGTTRGRVRAENQDKAVTANFEATNPQANFRACVVCDGLGGMQDGEQCAAEAVACFLDHLVSTTSVIDREQRLRSAVEFTNKELWKVFHERGGTTLAAILFTESGATAISVGDTRIYRLGEKGELTQLTVDDTIAGRLAELTDSPAGEHAGGPFGHHLAQIIGQSSPVSPQILDSKLLVNGTARPDNNGTRPGLLVTTDGAYHFGKDVFGGLARSAASARELVQRLISVSDWMGGTDNATAIYISLHETPPRPPGNRPGQLGLQIHDAYGELHVVPLTSEKPVSSEQVASAPPPIPETETIPEKRRIGSKNKRKGKRAPARKSRAGEKTKNPSQPELDIKVTQHSE
jgi:serine/threonine protein phosphatase PrpC